MKLKITIGHKCLSIISKTTLLCLLLAVVNACDTSNNVEPRFEQFFIKFYGEDGDQDGSSLAVLDDGGFALVGTTTTRDQGRQVYVVRTDAIGNEVWSNHFGGPNDDEGVDVMVDASGELVIAANTFDAQGESDVLLLKVSPSGELIMETTLTNPGDERVESLSRTAGGDYILTGLTTDVDVNKNGHDPITDLLDIFTIRTDASFQVLDVSLWIRRQGFPGVDEGTSVLQTNDGNFIVFGTTDFPPPGNSQLAGTNILAFPVDDNGIPTAGNSLQLFGTTANERAADIQQTADGGFVLLGTSTGQTEFNQLFLTRLRNNGDFINSILINSDQDFNVIAQSIKEIPDGGFIVLGDEMGNDNTNIYLARISPNGDTAWEETYGGEELDQSGEVVVLDDGGFAFIGTVELENQNKMSLIKTNASGTLVPEN
ncbi:MAG: hypothetical protein AAFX87_31165 [Bacteroidota bacterium]